MDQLIVIILVCLAAILLHLLMKQRKVSSEREKLLDAQIHSLERELEKLTADNQAYREKDFNLSQIYEHTCKIHLYSQLAVDEAKSDELKEKHQVILSECQDIFRISSILAEKSSKEAGR